MRNLICFINRSQVNIESFFLKAYRLGQWFSDLWIVTHQLENRCPFSFKRSGGRQQGDPQDCISSEEEGGFKKCYILSAGVHGDAAWESLKRTITTHFWVVIAKLEMNHNHIFEKTFYKPQGVLQMALCRASRTLWTLGACKLHF